VCVGGGVVGFGCCGFWGFLGSRGIIGCGVYR
jgi:hypothetical protein